MRIALAQLNPLVGDLAGNAAKILAACRKATNQASDVVLTPELSLWGYPPRDLLLRPLLIEQQNKILDEFANTLYREAPTLSTLIGIAEPILDFQLPQLFNSVALIEKATWRVVARKQLLPTYDVFDEKRYFRPAKTPGIVDLTVRERTWHLGITICEDLWVESELQRQRIAGPDPIAKLVANNIDLLINLSASPFSHSKGTLRQRIAAKATERLGCPVIYLNQVGGNDELIFDGASFILNEKAERVLTLPCCKEELTVWDLNTKITTTEIGSTTPEENLFQALVLGVRDYAVKCGFQKSLVGLSGGIDSALVVIIAAAALGVQKVTSILMPSPWSSSGSIDDAMGLAQRLGINTHTVPIATLMKSYESALAIPLGKSPEGITAENLQSRIRGTLLMAIANQQGHLLLATGNKSELAVGYCTLYGDMNGGLSVIGDLYKTCVFELCNWLDSQAAYKARAQFGLPSNGPLLGKAILEKPPSAELRPGQLDSDSLPDYEVLDPILKALIEEHQNPEELINSGMDPTLISRVLTMLKKAEFKRRQAPPLLKVSDQAFGSGWRIPIAST